MNRARIVGGEVLFEYTLDNDVPPLHNSFLYANRNALDMPQDFEFSRNHWAVKDVDLYRFMLRSGRPRRQLPTVFNLPDQENIEPTLASAMMPFDAGFNDVYAAIKQAAENAGLRCRRADDIWENPAIIHDVVSLIDRLSVWWNGRISGYLYLGPDGETHWTCNGFAPVTWLIMPAWLRMRAD